MHSLLVHGLALDGTRQQRLRQDELRASPRPFRFQRRPRAMINE
jgi:hypothetical protein